jgi:hypothetical protein
MNLAEILKQLGGVLRYLSAPFLAMSVIWALDKDHGIIRKVLEALSPSPAAVSPWPLAILLIVMGVAAYFAHRTVFHPLASRIVWRFALRKEQPRPRIQDLYFQRWRRRGGERGLAAQNVQVSIDEASAASHFFYCTAWMILVLRLVFGGSGASIFVLGTSNTVFTIIIVAFIALGIIGDCATTNWDLKAYKEFNCESSIPNTPVQLSIGSTAKCKV